MAHTLRLLPVALMDTDGRQCVFTSASSSLWAMALGFLLPALFTPLYLRISLWLYGITHG